MLGTFDRYLLSQLLSMFGFFSLVLVLVFWVNRAVSLFDRLIASGHSSLVFAEFSALVLPNAVRLVLPIAGLAATVYVANRMRGENELVIVQSGGFSPFRLARPVLVFGLVCALIASILTHLLVPISGGRLAERTTEIAEDVTAGLLTPGAFLHPGRGITFYIRNITPQSELEGVFLSDSRSGDLRETYTARRALLARTGTGPKLLMFDGVVQRYDRGTRRLATTRFEDFAFDIGGILQMPEIRESEPDEQPTPALAASLRAAPPEARAPLVLEMTERFSQAALALMAPLVGFAAMLVGGFSRFGAWPQIVLAIIGLIALDLIDNLALASVLERPEAWWLGGVPALAGLALTAGLLWLAGRPRRVRASSVEGVAP